MTKDLKKCCEIDETTQKLWNLSEKIEKLGTIILTVLLIYGAINTILTGVTTYAEIDSYASDDEATTGTISAVLTNIFTYFISALTTYCSYNVVSLILKAVGNIALNTKISSNISFYSVQNAEAITENLNKKSEENYKSKSNADELKKFKDLFDNGVITEEEFETKKKQLLGL